MTIGLERVFWSRVSSALRDSQVFALLISAARLRQEAQDFEVEPDCSVTMMPKAAVPLHVFGAPYCTPRSMKSKSSTRFNAAMATTNRLNPMLMRLELLTAAKRTPNMLSTISSR